MGRAMRVLARVLSAVAALGAAVPAGAGDARGNTQENVEARIEALLARMSPEEKAGQLNLVSYEDGFDQGRARRGEVGAVINFSNQALIAEVDASARASRLGIPVLATIDLVHGYRTIFPLPLAMAASFDPDLVRRAASAAAREARGVGISWSFAPMADTARDLRWGRVVEGSGEDPWLTGLLTAAQVEGFREGGVAATLKHFAGYGAVLGGRDYDSTFIPTSELYDTYLPPFRAGIRAGAESVMTALTALNGLPTTADAGLMRGILRHEMGFAGLVVADWQAVSGLIEHGVAADGAEATRKAFAAGVDMDMTSGLYLKHLPKEVRAGRIPQGALDDAVRRVLRLKFDLGLFERPVADPAVAPAPILTPEARKVAREAARKSFVLLKNEGGKDGALLPIDPARVRRLALVGPFADAAWDQIGPHEGNGQSGDAISFRAGLAERAARAGIDLAFAPGCARDCADAAGFGEAVAAAQEADLVLVVVGEGRDRSGEGNARADLGMPGRQQDLVRALSATGRPVVLLVFGGRPVTLAGAIERAGAAMMLWIPGIEGGPALAEILFGDADPSGKLPVSWPRSVGQMPLTYDRRAGGRPHVPGARWTLGYNDETIFPLFPFGHGLAYTRFEHGPPRVEVPAATGPDAVLVVRAPVTNLGPRAGRAVPQLYLSQPVAGRSRPLRLLKGIAPVTLAPGQSATAEFRVLLREIGFHEPDGTLTIEAGGYRVFVGEDSEAGASADFALGAGWRGPPGAALAGTGPGPISGR